MNKKVILSSDIKIKLSIITPTYNRCTSLSKNIQSVKEQGRTDIEHIIIDNLSNDGTQELVEQYKDEVPYEVVYIREQDSGIYNAMNKGILKAEGEWVHFLNSDDLYIEPMVLTKFIEYTKEQNVNKFEIACGSILFGEKKEVGIERIPRYHEKTSYHEFPHQGTFIKRSFFNKHGVYDERYKVLADSIYNARNYKKAQFLILPFRIAFMKSGGVSSSGSLRAEWEIMVSGVFFHRFGLKKKWQLLRKFLWVLVLRTRGIVKKSLKQNGQANAER